MLISVLAVLDGVAGAYLIRYALRRDKGAILASGIVLVICCLLLVAIALLPNSAGAPEPAAPAVDL